MTDSTAENERTNAELEKAKLELQTTKEELLLMRQRLASMIDEIPKDGRREKWFCGFLRV